MKSQKIKLLMLTAVLILIWLQACGQQEDQKVTTSKQKNGEIFQIGLSLAITGPTSDAGNPYSKGIEDYIRYANETSILGNAKIECLIRDDQYKIDVTKRNFENFLAKGIVMYLNYSTGSTLALKKVFEKEKIPVIPASFHAGNLENSNYIFLPIISYSAQAIGLSEYVVNNHSGGTPKVAMYIHPSAFGRGPVEDVKKAVTAGLDMQIVEVVEHNKDLDNTAMLKQLMSKNVRYVICHTVQSPVATLLKDAQQLGVKADDFGQQDKLTFLGVHYTGGNDLITLAGSAAENFYWTTAYTLTSIKNEGTLAQLNLAQKYGRNNKTANSHNYTNGVMVAQIAVESIRRARAKGIEVNRETLYHELNSMHGYNAYYPITTVGPVSFSKSDRAGVDRQQLYCVQNGVFQMVGVPFASKYMNKI